MRNLARINNYFNRLAAWDDWRALSAQAAVMGQEDVAKSLQPPPDASWRKIDKATKMLRVKLASILEAH